MKAGKQAWYKQLSLIEYKLHQARTKAQPAEALYQNDLRTPLFMLEGLARVYSRLWPKQKHFGHLLKTFKALEDSLGAIDYYDNYFQQSQAQSWPVELQSYFKKHYQDSLRNFNKELKKQDWMNKHGQLKTKTPNKIAKKIKKAKWPQPKAELLLLSHHLQKRIRKVDTNFKQDNYDLNLLEEGIHELRRNLRWFSIYMHALNGMFCLTDATDIPEAFQKYVTDAARKSPFNQIDCDARLKAHQIPNYLFFALGKLISELGDIKDAAQLHEAVAHAAVECQLSEKQNVNEFSRQLLGQQYMDFDEATTRAQKISQQILQQDQLLAALIQILQLAST